MADDVHQVIGAALGSSGGMIVLVQDPAEPLASPDVQAGDLVRDSDRRR
jgi:hypothetical protein